MGRALVYFSTLLGSWGSAPLPGKVGIPSRRTDRAQVCVWHQGRPLSLLPSGDAGPWPSDLGAVPMSKERGRGAAGSSQPL